MATFNSDLHIETDALEVADLLEEVGSKILSQSEVSALNKAVTAERKDLVSIINQSEGIPKAVLNKRFVTRKRASVKSPFVRLFVGLYNVLAFPDLKAKELKRGGVSYSGKGGRVKAPQAFFATMPKSGHYGVYVRKTTAPGYDGRLPIKALSVNFSSKARMQVQLSKNRIPRKFNKLFEVEFGQRVEKAIRKRRAKTR